MDELILDVFRSTGLQPNEIELSEGVKSPSKIQLNTNKIINESETLNEVYFFF